MLSLQASHMLTTHVNTWRASHHVPMTYGDRQKLANSLVTPNIHRMKKKNFDSPLYVLIIGVSVIREVSHLPPPGFAFCRNSGSKSCSMRCSSISSMNASISSSISGSNPSYSSSSWSALDGRKLMEGGGREREGGKASLHGFIAFHRLVLTNKVVPISC